MTRSLLARADHDYNGQRTRAVHQIDIAIHSLGQGGRGSMNGYGNGNNNGYGNGGNGRMNGGNGRMNNGGANGQGNREPQAVSDGQLRQAVQNLSTIQPPALLTLRPPERPTRGPEGDRPSQHGPEYPLIGRRPLRVLRHRTRATTDRGRIFLDVGPPFTCSGGGRPGCWTTGGTFESIESRRGGSRTHTHRNLIPAALPVCLPGEGNCGPGSRTRRSRLMRPGWAPAHPQSVEGEQPVGESNPPLLAEDQVSCPIDERAESRGVRRAGVEPA